MKYTQISNISKNKAMLQLSGYYYKYISLYIWRVVWTYLFLFYFCLNTSKITLPNKVYFWERCCWLELLYNLESFRQPIMTEQQSAIFEGPFSPCRSTTTSAVARVCNLDLIAHCVSDGNSTPRRTLPHSSLPQVRISQHAQAWAGVCS